MNHMTPGSALQHRATRKRDQYEQICKERHALFRSLIMPTDGGECHWETETFLEQVAHAFAQKAQESWKASADDGNNRRILSLRKMAPEENCI